MSKYNIPQTKAHKGKPKQEEYLEKIEDQNSVGTSVILGVSGDRLKIPVVNHHNVYGVVSTPTEWDAKLFGQAVRERNRRGKKENKIPKIPKTKPTRIPREWMPQGGSC